MEKIVIVDEDGNEKNANLITILTLDEHQNAYLVYSEDELKDSSNRVLLAKMVEDNGQMFLDNIEDEKEKQLLFEEFKKKMGV